MSFLQKFFGKRETAKNDPWQVPIVQQICIDMIHQIPVQPTRHVPAEILS